MNNRRMNIVTDTVLYHCTANYIFPSIGVQMDHSVALCGTTTGPTEDAYHICLRPEYWKRGLVKCKDCLDHPDYALILLASF